MPAPSDAELDVLKVFWRHGPMSAREVHLHAGPELGWADTTTRTVLERMRVKGLLSRRMMHGMGVYAPAGDKLQVLGGVLSKLRDVLEIDGAISASAFAGSQILSADEIAELQALINAETEEEQ